MLGGQAGGDGAQPSYVERGKDSWRGYFGWMPAGTHAVEYVVRLNGSGRFTLPPTRSEEHTSELQSLMRISYAGFCLKKKKTDTSAHVCSRLIRSRADY